MPHDIIDNRTEKLVDAIRRLLPGSASAKFAVGYFFLSGLEAVTDQLANVRELRLLIGNTSNRETIEQIAEGYRRLEQVQEAAEALQYPKRAAMEAAARATAHAIGQTAAALDQTDGAAALVGTLVRLIEEGRLQVKVYTQGRLHAKAYIFDYAQVYDAQGQLIERQEKGLAIVGSSNFTLSGVVANTELNVVVSGNTNHAELTSWFEALWEEAQDFEAQLMQELRQSWPLAEVTPYELYLKTLQELVRDQLEGADIEEILWQDDITAMLTEFQERAVLQAVQMIRRYGGCFVADVVGLGKSYIGAAIVKHFERHDRARSLIICPAPLVEMWEHYNEAYQLNARVLSMGLLHEMEPYGAEWLLRDDRYRNRDFVLVDESHNFRNTGTQRYRVLQSFLASGDRRVAFLTATPRNKSVWDIFNQLKLFHPEDKTLLPVDPPNLRTFFQGVEAGERRLPELLAHILIRRTRAHILRWYGYDAETHQRVDPEAYAAYKSGARKAYVQVGGRQQFFPRRELETIEYSIEDVYGGFYESLRGYLSSAPSPTLEGMASEEGEALTFARYGLWNYVIPAKQERPPYNDLRRAGANLRGLLRVMLFKRLESSVHAFRKTVQRMLKIHQRFLQALDQGIVAAGEAAQDLLYESDQDEEQALWEALEQVTGRYDPADFDLEALHADLEHDIRILRRMLTLVQPVTPERDAKLLTLTTRLAQPPLNQGKVLIFTQFADTAQYLYDALSPGHAHPDIEVIYSREKSKAQVVARFAPKANPQLPLLPGIPELQTLIATDVLSEGLNLQDCDNVINYDLHWNPVRLIQRFGRIDRIGSEHDRIYAYNFLPETALERALGLRERLARRIQEIHDTMGEDAAILEPGERLNEEALYAIYTRGDLSRYEDEDGGAGDEFVDLNEALELVRQLREDQPELYRRITDLRDGVRCGHANRQMGGVVLCRAGSYRQLYQVNADGEIISRDIPHILHLMKCAPDTRPAALPAGHNALVGSVRRSFEREVSARQAEQRHTLTLTKAQRYVLAELRVWYGEAEESLRPQIARLDAIFQQALTRPVVREALNRLRREQFTGRALMEALLQLVHLHGLDEAASHRPQTSEGENDALPIVVCSEGWVGE